MSVMTIDRSTVFQKTERGRAEVGARLAGLTAVQRQLLIVIDGQKAIESLAAMFPRADVLDAVGFLLKQKLVETAEPPLPVAFAATVDPAFGAFRKAIVAPLAVDTSPDASAVAAPDGAGAGDGDGDGDGEVLLQARSLMIGAARENIGLLGERLIARIELARSLADLAVVAGHWHMALRDSKRGRPVADALQDRVLRLLGEPAHAGRPA